MANARTLRTDWIAAGLRALTDGGVDAVRIEALARALGVTKGGFYGYFADRQALLDQMLDAWEQDVTTAVIARAERSSIDARAKLLQLFTIAASGDGLLTDIATDFAIRDWARRDPAVAERLRRVDNQRMDYLRTLFGAIFSDPDEVEARATFCFMVRAGSRFVDLDHGGRSPTEVTDLLRRWLVT